LEIRGDCGGYTGINSEKLFLFETEFGKPYLENIAVERLFPVNWHSRVESANSTPVL